VACPYILWPATIYLTLPPAIVVSSISNFPFSYPRHWRLAVTDNRRVPIDEIGYLPLAREQANLSSRWWPSAMKRAR
jgi:hypothetical protein